MKLFVTTFFVMTVALSATSANVLKHEEAAHHPRYAYKYWVHDPHTKDIKEHWEARDGDLVKGSYSLVEPNGKLRVVDYWADDAHGFNADVKRIGEADHKISAPVLVLPETEAKNVVAVEENAPQIEQDSVAPLTPPANYGFSSSDKAPDGHIYANVGSGSLRWDPKTGSYGGWVPRRPREPHAIIFSKKYIDGKLHKLAIGPISLKGRTLVFKVKH